MANNTTLNLGAGGDVIATEDIGAVKYELVKLVNSTAGSTTRTGVAADPLRVDPTGSTAQPVTDNGGSLTVDGSVSITGTVGIKGLDGSAIASNANPVPAKLTDGTNPAVLEAAPTFGTSVLATAIGLTTNARNAQYWSTAHHGVNGDGEYYAQNMNDQGDLCASLSSLTHAAGSTVVQVGVGAPGNGTQRVAAAAMDGAGNALTSAARGSERALSVQIVDAAGAQVTGLATAANQSTEITHLATLAGAVKAEDAAHTTGDTGVMAFSVRRDADTAFGADNDYAPLATDANGYLKVNIKAGAGSGGTAMTDDAAFTAATTSFTPVGGIVTADSVDSGDGGAFAMLANRQQKVTLYDSAGVELAVGGGTQYTEDAAAAANPVGNALNLIRDDARGGSLTTTDGDNVAARGTNAGELYVKHVDPITVNSHAVTNAGTFAVQVSSIAAGDNNIGNVDIVTLPALAAGTNNIGDVDVLSVIPGTGATNLGKATDTAAGATDTGVAPLAIRDDALSALTPVEGDYAPLRVDGQGALWVMHDGNVTINSPAVTNAGTFAVQVDGAALTALQLLDDVVATDGSAAPTKGYMLAGTDGTNAQTVKVDASGELQVDVLTLPAIPAGSNLIGSVNPEPKTTGGLTISRTLSAASTNATSVKASAGQVYSIYGHNINAAVRYLKLYNKASSPTVGTDTPVMTLPIPGNTAGAGFVLDTGGMGIAFATGIALALTTGLADADTGAVAANEIVVNLLYK